MVDKSIGPMPHTVVCRFTLFMFGEYGVFQILQIVNDLDVHYVYDTAQNTTCQCEHGVAC